MTEQLTLKHERVDDIPLLLAQMERMQVTTLLDKCFPTHGNWEGLSLGQVVSSNPRLRLKARKQGVGAREFLRFATL